MTECITDPIDFSSVSRTKIQADFNGGKLTSDAGTLLLREVDRRERYDRQKSPTCWAESLLLQSNGLFAGKVFDHPQSITSVLQLEDSRLRSASVRGVQNGHKLAVKRCEQHAVPPIFLVQWFVLLLPGPGQFAGKGRESR